MIYEPSYIYPNVLNAQGERCFYTMQNNTFRILVNSDYPIASVTYTIYNPDSSVEISDTITGLDFYTNTIDGEQNILEIPNVSLQNENDKIDIGGGVVIDPDIFSDTIWTYILEFTDSLGNTYTSKKYAFYITPSPDFVSIVGEEIKEVGSRSSTFEGSITYETQPISWIQWDVNLDSVEGQTIYTTGKIYRSVPFDFYFDGFDSGSTYFVTFTASDTRGNVSHDTQEVIAEYEYSEQFDSIETRVMPDSSILIDWSSLQGIEGVPEGIVIEDEDEHYLLNTPVEGHTSINLPEGDIDFVGSSNIGLNIPNTNYFIWSGKLFGNTPNIIEAIDENEDVMSLSLENYASGLFPSENLYPSNTLYPSNVTKGRFKYIRPNGDVYYWDSWASNLDVTNAWFVVKLSPTSISVYQTEWRQP